MSPVASKIDEFCTVDRLLRYLDVNLSSSLLLVMMIFWSFALILLSTGAVVFAIFMMIVLYKERRFGWMIGFPIVVLLPPACVSLMDIPDAYKTSIGLSVLVLFYIYCFFLKLSIPDWEN